MQIIVSLYYAYIRVVHHSLEYLVRTLSIANADVCHSVRFFAAESEAMTDVGIPDGAE